MPAEISKRSSLLIPLILAVTVMLFESYGLLRLRQENAELKEEINQLKELAKRKAEAARGPLSPEELESLRQSKSELQRLRGQFAVLRKQLQDGPEKKPVEPPLPPLPTKEEPSVQTYTATASAQLKPDEIMVTGGWSAHAGKSVWIIISSTVGEPNGVTPGQVTLDHKIIEVPDTVARNLGLAELKTSQINTTRHGVFDAQQTEVFWKQLEESDGVALLASPKISTLSGRPAQVSALSPTLIDGKQYQLGPTMDVTPTILESGELSLKVVGVLTLRN